MSPLNVHRLRWSRQIAQLPVRFLTLVICWIDCLAKT